MISRGYSAIKHFMTSIPKDVMTLFSYLFENNDHLLI